MQRLGDHELLVLLVVMGLAVVCGVTPVQQFVFVFMRYFTIKIKHMVEHTVEHMHMHTAKDLMHWTQYLAESIQ